MTELRTRRRIRRSRRPDDHSRRRRRAWVALSVLVGVVAVSIGVSVVMDTNLGTTILALLLGLVILRIGWFFLQQFATPPPPPPEEGALRKVKLTYRCSICGAEVRMTVGGHRGPRASPALPRGHGPRRPDRLTNGVDRLGRHPP